MEEGFQDGSGEVVAACMTICGRRSPEASIEVWYPRAALGEILERVSLSSGNWRIYGKYAHISKLTASYMKGGISGPG
jgi:hypothetical protein